MKLSVMKLSVLVAFILAFGLSVSAANAANFEGLVIGSSVRD